MRTLLSLTKHLEKHQQMLRDAVPKKHAGRPDIYHAYLKAEISRTERTIEDMKLSTVKPGK